MPEGVQAREAGGGDILESEAGMPRRGTLLFLVPPRARILPSTVPAPLGWPFRLGSQAPQPCGRPSLLDPCTKPRVKPLLLGLCCLPWLAACQTPRPVEAPKPAVQNDTSRSAESAVHALVDRWHAAAAGVRAEEYLAALAPDAVFLGTDPGERWDKASFAEYVRHYFEGQGRGWKYVPSQRTVQLAPDGRTAWFDERLENAGYGILRGTGVVRLDEAGWRIVHYSMTFAIPNEQARAVVEVVRAGQASNAPATDTSEGQPAQASGNGDAPR